MDEDLQNPPEEIKKLLKTLRENYDVVGTITDNRNDPFSRKVSSKLVNSLVRNFCKGHTMQDYGCMLRGYKRNIVNIILQCNERRRFIPMMAMSFARNPIEIHVNHSKRTAGESKYRFGDLISLLFDLLITTSVIPLRVLTFIGFLIAIFGFVFGLVIFILSQIDKQWGAEGTFALFAIMFVLTGGVFAALGLIGEYIGGIHLNTQQHPLYVIEEILDKESN